VGTSNQAPGRLGARVWLAALALAASVVAIDAATAAVKVQTVDYENSGATLEGAYVWDDATDAKRPGVVVYHTYTGPTEHEMDAAKRLAAMGYVAFVADIYGKGIRPPPPKESAAEAAKYGKNRPLLRARAVAALDMLKKSPVVDLRKLAAIGYCFGGGAALELARSGADVLATVVFHATLSSPTPDDARNIKGAVLALHGADDPIVPRPEVDAFIKEMSDAKADWQLVLYADTDHGFTTKRNIGAPKSSGNVYNEKSDKRSWAAMQDLLREKFAD
jgi:dienelactone hydrolase